MRYTVKRNRGFTLMELLVVMAISVILMGLVLAPVVKSFQLTRAAQAMVDSQDAARAALLSISRELGQAMFVYDNAQNSITTYTTGLPSSVDVSKTQSPIMLPVAQPGSPNPTTQWFVLPNAKIDFILPKILMHCNNPDHPTGKPRDYPRTTEVTGDGPTRTELGDWPDCPYCKAAGKTPNDVEARPKMPLEQDVTVVRYFIGLRNNNLDAPIIGPVLNKGWVSPWRKNVVDGTENASVLYRVEFNPFDDNLFPAGTSVSERLSDPYFFYREGNGASGTFRENWKRLARVVGIGKYEDLVTATYDASDNVASVDPTITFRTSSVENDTFTPAYVTDKTNDYPTAAPTVYRGTYGYWTPDFRVDVMRGDYWVDPPQGLDFFTKTINNEIIVMKREPAGNAWNDTPNFNITQYAKDGYVPPDDASKDPVEMAFTIDLNSGAVSFAMQPPSPGPSKDGPIADEHSVYINQDFRNALAIDRGGAVRRLLLPTFDSAKTDQYIKNARIVPGSERIVGPDMTFGPHFAKPVRYERVPLQLGDPGANQYKIDYDSGWVFFSRDPNLDLPENDPTAAVQRTSVQASYLIYFNQKDDVVRASYLTKTLINVHIGMRMFDPDSGKPYPVDLSNSVKVRNVLR